MNERLSIARAWRAGDGVSGWVGRERVMPGV
jgi:hypothetical protein